MARHVVGCFADSRRIILHVQMAWSTGPLRTLHYVGDWHDGPIIFAAAMEAAPPELAGTLVGFLFTGNMGISFLAPIVAGIVADAYGLAIALAFVGVFPLLACIATLVYLMIARVQ